MFIKKENMKELMSLVKKDISEKNFKYYWNEIIWVFIVIKWLKLILYVKKVVI